MALAETARARRRLVEEAGFSTTSWISVLAGTLVALGAVAFVATAAASAPGLDTDGITTHEWRLAGLAAAGIAAVVTLAGFYLGGYTAGRMSRRSGARHGILVSITSVVLIALIGGLADLREGDGPAIVGDEREQGRTTTSF